MGNQVFKSFFIDDSDHPALVIVFNLSNQPHRRNGSSGCCRISKEQIKKILSSSQANAAVTEPSLSKVSSCNWIIDSGATDHISSSLK